jgi:hypothetical protein
MLKDLFNLLHRICYSGRDYPLNEDLAQQILYIISMEHIFSLDSAASLTLLEPGPFFEFIKNESSRIHTIRRYEEVWDGMLGIRERAWPLLTRATMALINGSALDSMINAPLQEVDASEHIRYLTLGPDSAAGPDMGAGPSAGASSAAGPSAGASFGAGSGPDFGAGPGAGAGNSTSIGPDAAAGPRRSVGVDPAKIRDYYDAASGQNIKVTGDQGVKLFDEFDRVINNLMEHKNEIKSCVQKGEILEITTTSPELAEPNGQVAQEVVETTRGAIENDTGNRYPRIIMFSACLVGGCLLAQKVLEKMPVG